MNLTERDMLLDLLLHEKTLAEQYNRAEAECTHQELREQLHTLHSAHEAQHSELFKEAHKRGYYRTPIASRNQIEELLLHWEQKPARDPVLDPGPARAGR